MDDVQRRVAALEELDARHNALLDEIDALDRRVKAVLAEFTPRKETSPAPVGPDGDSTNTQPAPAGLPVASMPVMDFADPGCPI